MRESFNNIDNISLASIEKEAVINSLHETFEKQKKNYQPKPEDFFEEPGFNKDDIKKEIEKTESLKLKWESQNSDKEKENKKISDVFEGIIVDQFCGEWMSNKAEAFFASEPDDILRKVDCVIELDAGEGEKHEYLGLGIDVTFSSDYTILNSKLADAWKDVENNKKVSIKYVDTNHYKGSLDICRIVLATDKETVFRLASLYKNRNKNEEKIKELNNDPFLANIMWQMRVQLEAYFDYAKSKKRSVDYLQHITKTLNTFYNIYKDKEQFVTDHEKEISENETFKTVYYYCQDKLKSTNGN